MAATTYGTDGLVYNVAVESGIILQNIESRESISEFVVPDENGEDIGWMLYNKQIEVSGEFFYAGESGLASLAMAAAATLDSGNYTPTGVLVLTARTLRRENTGAKRGTFTLKEKPLVTAS